MKEFWESMMSAIEGKGVEIVVGVIFLAITTFLTFMRKKIKNWGVLKYRKSRKRVAEAGVVTFYYNRKILQSDAGTIGDYIATAQKSVLHVGFWLSSSLTSQNLEKAVLEAINRGVHLQFCILSPKSALIEAYTRFFDTPEENILSSINNTLAKLMAIKKSLPPDKQDNLKIYTHNEIVTASFWVIDREDSDKCMVQIDHKIIYNPRYSSYGMEIKPSSDRKEFAQSFMDGYVKVVLNSEELKG